MGRHDLAMYHAQSSIMLVQQSLLIEFLPSRKDTKKTSKEKEKDKEREKEKDEELKKEFKDRISTLAVSYHNLGVEQEFLKMYNESIESYKQAANFASRYLGAEDDIFKNLNNVYLKAKQELDRQMQKNKAKQMRMSTQYEPR